MERLRLPVSGAAAADAPFLAVVGVVVDASSLVSIASGGFEAMRAGIEQAGRIE